jgi:hypothetical protein
MGSDGAGCTDFGVSRQGELTNILPCAGLTCLQNKGFAAQAALTWSQTALNQRYAALNLKNHKAISQSELQGKNRLLPTSIRRGFDVF